MRTLLSWPNYFPKTSPPNTIMLDMRIRTFEFVRNTNIHTTVRCEKKTVGIGKITLLGISKKPCGQTWTKALDKLPKVSMWWAKVAREIDRMKPLGCHLDDRDLQVLKQREKKRWDWIACFQDWASKTDPRLTQDWLLLIEHSHAVLERGNQKTSISPSNSCASETSC